MGERVYEIDIDQIGFVYQGVEFQHDADGVSKIILKGESLGGNGPMQMHVDALIPRGAGEDLRTGDISFDTTRLMNGSS